MSKQEQNKQLLEGEHSVKGQVQLLTNNGKYLIDKISQEKLTYFVAILASYGEGTRQSIDTFISESRIHIWCHFIRQIGSWFVACLRKIEHTSRISEF